MAMAALMETMAAAFCGKRILSFLSSLPCLVSLVVRSSTPEPVLVVFKCSEIALQMIKTEGCSKV